MRSHKAKLCAYLSAVDRSIDILIRKGLETPVNRMDRCVL